MVRYDLLDVVRYYVWAVVLAAALCLIFFIWSRILKRRVELRTAELGRSEEALRFTQYAIDRTVDQAFWMTEDGRLFYVNDAACRALGYSREELVGMSIPEIDPTHPPEVFAEHWRTLVKHGCITMESLHRAKDGRVYPVEIRSNYVVFDGREYNCAFATDISERKRMETELRHARDELETRVKERTAELECANEMLEREILVRKRTENVNSARLRLLEFAAIHNMEELLQATLDEAESLTGSLIGFYHFLETDQKTLTLQNWSTRTKAEFCKAEGKGSHYDVAAAGVWVDCLHERRPVVHNDYASLPHRRGLPPGHAPVVRELVVPVFRKDKIVAVFGVGNKPQDYISEDIETVSTLADLAWDIVERKQAEEALHLSRFCIDKAGIGIWQSDEKGTIFNVNEHACKSLGYSREELFGLNIFDIDPGITLERMLELGEILRETGSVTLQTTHRRRDGTTFPVEVTANLLEFRGKEYAISFVQDITGRKQAEKALQESESRVRRKLESILDPGGDVADLDLADILDTQQIQAIMEDLYAITGLKMSILDLDGRVLADVGWQDICLEFHRKHPETLKRCHESDTDLAVGVPEGEFRTYRCRNNMWHLVTPIIVAGKHMANLFLGQFFFDGEQIDYGLFREQARRYGFPEEEYIVALEAVPHHNEELVNLGKAVFLKLTDMLSRLSYANIKLAQTLAEQDRLTATLREANLVVENSPAVLFLWKAEDGWPVELVSDNVKQFGYAPEDFLSGALTYASIIHPDDLERVTREVGESCEKGADQLQLEYRIVTREGEVRWINEHSHIERDTSGSVKTFEGIVIDVTERKRMEEELYNSREKYQSMVEAFDGFIYICSQDYRIEFMNPKLVEWTGKDAVGQLCYKTLHGRDEICPWCVNDRVFQGESVHWEIQCNKDGRWYHVVNVPLYNANGTISKHSIITDIHLLKMTEESLREQKKLLENLNATLEKRVGEEVRKNREKDVVLIQQNRQAAMGELLDHIAHQWKQPLTVISLLVQNLEESHDRGELTDLLLRETIDKMLDLLDHMEQTIEVFRDFYRPDKGKTVFRVREAVDRALDYMGPALKFHSIAIEYDVDPELRAMGYPKEYTQALLNLLSNARDVLRDRKTEKPKIIISGFAADNQAVVSIKDNAGGIPEAIFPKIFDLYVTTKEATGGSGIGLHISKNIIENNMQGSLMALNSTSGAEFRLCVRMPEADAVTMEEIEPG
ncbi:MAG: PAS domain S-box protein [Syntrophotaleaceae bacterium]